MLNYDKLWHRLLDEKLNKRDLCKMTGISSSTMAKLGKNEIVSLEVLEKVCSTLNCDLGDIASFKSSNEQKG
jgi:DNA-binding Xre family transcriptional regulator